MIYTVIVVVVALIFIVEIMKIFLIVEKRFIVKHGHAEAAMPAVQADAQLERFRGNVRHVHFRGTAFQQGWSLSSRWMKFI